MATDLLIVERQRSRRGYLIAALWPFVFVVLVWGVFVRDPGYSGQIADHHDALVGEARRMLAAGSTEHLETAATDGELARTLASLDITARYVDGESVVFDVPTLGPGEVETGRIIYAPKGMTTGLSGSCPVIETTRPATDLYRVQEVDCDAWPSEGRRFVAVAALTLLCGVVAAFSLLAYHLVVRARRRAIERSLAEHSMSPGAAP